MIKSRNALIAMVAAVMAGAFTTQGSFAQDKKTLAFVVNVPADFWQIARRGTEKAQKELPNYNIEFYIPGEMSAAAQKRILEDLLAKGVAGVSISPVNPDNSSDILNQVASKAACSPRMRMHPSRTGRSISGRTTWLPAGRPASR
jgi:ribose transport system substrate-binding protein